LQQAGNSHEAIANRLDLLEPMLRRDSLEHDEERIQPRHYVLRLMLVAIGREVDHVAEQHRDVLVASRDHAADASYFVGGLFRQKCMQKLVGLLARILCFCERFLQRKLGPDPRRGRIEPSLASRLSQILINQRVILESFDAEKRIQQLETVLEAAGHGKVLPMKKANG
jgi:hypothetical protein